jgi:GNAT superfamily N-acetyltransferase
MTKQAIIEAIEVNLRQLYHYFAAAPEIWVDDTPQLFRVNSSFPSLFFNTVLSAHLNPAELDTAIETTRHYFAGLEQPLRWLITPLSTPADLPDHLIKYGLNHNEDGDTTGMAADLLKINRPPIGSTNFSIMPVNDPATLQQYVEAFFGPHPDPQPISQIWCNLLNSLGLEETAPLRHYVGLAQEKPVATASVFYGTGVAGIYFVYTADEFRGQGLGTALVQQTLADARQRGYEIAILHSSKMGYSVYSRLGFKEYCRIKVYTNL